MTSTGNVHANPEHRSTRSENDPTALRNPDIDMRDASTLQLGFATTRSELLEVQRLRYQVFARELGARLAGQIEGIDADAFDAYCDHLLVRDRRCGRIVGSYRILRPEQAAALGKYYAEDEFDLSRLCSLRPGLVELGRACVAQGYRSGAP